MDQLIVEDPPRIGPYRLIARLGAGGMGLVYLGRSEGGRTVAVKVVQAEYAGNPEFRRRFAREVAAARRVGGSWTAAVLDADPEAAVPWVATRYIPGPDLHAVVAKDFGPLPEHSVRTLANRLALALQAVHEAGLIHRDLKPSNVLITVDGPRVIDFGIARAMDSLAGDSLLTHTGMLIGSAGFMSPEQVRGRELTPASDVFCLGAVLVYAATGRLLFGAADTGLNAHLFRVAEEEPDLTGVPEELVELVRDCLHKDPTRRPTPAQVAERTAADEPGEWLPGQVLAQLGRHAAQLLDFAPARLDEAPAPPPDPRVPSPRPQLPAARVRPHGPGPSGPAQGFGPSPAATPADGWPLPPPEAAGVPADPHTRRRRGLVVAALLQLVVLLEGTVFDLAGPLVHAEFGLGYDSMDLVFVTYWVVFGGLLLLGGRIVDRVGRRQSVIIGLVGFAVACALGGAASSSAMLISARALQGAFAALLTPAALSLVSTGFTDPKGRGRAFGVYAALAGGGSVLGLFAGGFAYNLVWRWSFYVAVPIAVIALLVALALPRDRPAPAGARLDVPGLLLGSTALAALIYGLHAGGWHGWTAPLTLFPLVGGAVLLGAFLWQQSRASSPMLAGAVLGDRNRLGALLVVFLAGIGTLLLFAFLNFWIREVLGYSANGTALLLLPMAAAIPIGSTQVSARLTPRVAPGILIAVGMALTAAGLLVLTGLESGGPSVPVVLSGSIVTGLGIGLAYVPVFDIATAGIDPRQAGATAGVIGTAQQLGEAIGVVLLTVTVAESSAVDFQERLSGYADTLWWALGVVLLAAVLAGLMVNARAPRSAVRQPAEPLR
ncbi:MDR family MFS transporter [Streptomyces sp. ZAF1911]|uniref:MDR family MFS transporter n=1 Tax=Streptomyces sp. ZAF1911 TaxID=2944129 RepID=UPI00237A2AC9|nr:MDR family MFS transporter [Streptomyces sp. ZAF1911]MDD9379405.1 MDR family MFS transporter [Streptomyces sp. ZAF1911]